MSTDDRTHPAPAAPQAARSRLDDVTDGSRPLVVFLGDDVDEEDHDILFPALRRRGVSVVRVHPFDLDVAVDDGSTLLSVDGQPIRPSLVVGWVLEDLLWPGMALLEVIERAGIPVLNDAMTLFRAQDKMTMSAVLHHASVPHYPAWTGRGQQAAREWLAAGHLPAVSKPLQGYGGSGLTLVTTVDDLPDAPADQLRYLVPWVDNPGRDIRVYTLDHHAVFAMYRHAPADGWVTNVKAGGSISYCPLTPELVALAETASRAAGTPIGGVDVAETPDGLVVHEVNSCPTCEPPVLELMADFLAATVTDPSGTGRPWTPSHVHTEAMSPREAFHASKVHLAR